MIAFLKDFLALLSLTAFGSVSLLYLDMIVALA